MITASVMKQLSSYEIIHSFSSVIGRLHVGEAWYYAVISL